MPQLNQDYVTKWVEWFLVEQDKQGMEREVRDSLEQCLGMFFASQAAFDLHTKNISSQGLKCPKCHGRGHMNLYLAGAKEPVPCANCNGTGNIQGD
jgi:DnaJ-class molecular chaperone